MNFLMPLGDFLSRQKVMEFYRYFNEAQWWQLSRLQEVQEAGLRKTLEVSFREVPYYRDLMVKCGADPSGSDIRSQLRKIPPTAKTDLRKAFPQGCTRDSGKPTSRAHTSGSSGEPFAVLIDSDSLSRARALMMLRATFCGWEIGMPLLQTGMSLDRGLVKRAKDYFLGTEYVSAFDLSNNVLDRYLDTIVRKKLQFVMGYPGSLYFLAKRAGEVGCGIRMKGAVTWGDNLYSHYRKTIEENFGCAVTDTYGCGEGIQIAAQCGCKGAGYHIFMPHVLVEIVDDSGQEVSCGERGNILLTRLDPGAMPLIRYRVGDVGRLKAGGRCSCGRELDSLVCVEGRDTDVVVTPNGNRLIVHFFTGIFEYYSSIETFKVEQEKVEGITVKIVPGVGFTENICKKIEGEIHEKGDPSLEIDFEIVDKISLERSNKRRFVVSKVGRTESA